MEWIVSSAIATELIAREFKVSNGAAAVALWGEEGASPYVQRSWLFDVIVENSVAAVRMTTKQARTEWTDKALLEAHSEIVSRLPFGTWGEHWELYQVEYAPVTGISYVNAPANYKKAVQRAEARQGRRSGQ